jgi:hypothetical protein
MEQSEQRRASMRNQFRRFGSMIIASGVALAVAAPAAFAQAAPEQASAPAATLPVHLSASFAPGTPVPDAPIDAALTRSMAAAGGIGFGIKGGPVFADFSSNVTNFNTKTGWAAGIFIGGSRAHTLGGMTEILYTKKTSEANGVSTDVYSVFIPAFLRVNVGTHSTTGPAVYLLLGTAVDIKTSAKAGGQDVSSSYRSVDIDFAAGAGFEVARIIVEGRYVWGLLNVATNNILNSSDLKTRSFQLMFGFRIN